MKNKLGSALLSLLIAFGLWIYVITEVSPDSKTTIYDIPVSMTGETALSERGLMITAWSDTTVDLELSGNRTDLNEVNKGNITLKADLTSIYDPGVHQIEYKISYPGNVANNAYNVESQNPKTISITVERRATEEIPVTVIYQGTLDSNYVSRKSEITLDYETIQVVGPSSVVEQIKQAVIVIDLTDRTESVSENYRYTLCDGDGNPVDSEMITVNTEEVHVDLTIHRVKQVKLDVTIVDGGGATSDTVSYVLSSDIIQVSGSDAALEQVGDTIILGTINLADYEEDTQFTFPIPTYEGVTNESGKTEVTVDLKFDGLAMKEVVIEQFDTADVPEGFEAQIITERLMVKVRGPVELVKKLTAEDLTATVYFTEAEAGTSTYKVTITFPEEFSAVGVLGKPSVTASLQEAEK